MELSDNVLIQVSNERLEITNSCIISLTCSQLEIHALMHRMFLVGVYRH